MSKNTVSKFWNDLGKAYSRICKYMQIRVAALETGHHVIIDATLKSNDSKVNRLSDFSRKILPCTWCLKMVNYSHSHIRGCYSV